PEYWRVQVERFGVSLAVCPFQDMDEKTNKKDWSCSDVIRNGMHYVTPHYHVLYIARIPVTIESVR
ncbi:replication protein RepB, partial [Enterococcus faecium]